MPKEYEAIRDSLLKRGKSPRAAKRIAAATWNKRHPKDTNPWAREPSFSRKVKRGMARAKRR